MTAFAGGGMNRRNFLIGLAGALVFPPLPGRRAAGSGGTGGKGTMDFNAVNLGEDTPNDCTPVLDEGFTGIRIAAPERVVRGKDQFAVCGTYRFPAEYIYTFDDIIWSIVFVVVNASNHRPISFDMVEPGDTPERGTPPDIQDPPWMSNHFVQGYFNKDPRALVENWPEETADYFIYAVLENHVSNLVKVSYVV